MVFDKFGATLIQDIDRTRKNFRNDTVARVIHNLKILNLKIGTPVNVNAFNTNEEGQCIIWPMLYRTREHGGNLNFEKNEKECENMILTN